MSAIETIDAAELLGAGHLPEPKAMPELLAIAAELFAGNVDLATHGTYVIVSHTGSISVGFRASSPTIEALRALVRVSQAMGGVLTTHRHDDGVMSVDGDFAYHGIPIATYTTVPPGTS